MRKLHVVRTRLTLMLILAMAAALLPGVARASVATSCSFDAGTATVTAVIGSGASTTLIRNGDAIEFGGLACGAATVTKTDTIQISDPDAGTGESLTVSLAGGRLVPGKTPEDDGTDEIEILAGSYTGGFTLIGSDVADNVYVCSGDINLNNNVSGDTEIYLPTTTALTTVDGGKGNDVLRTKMYESVVSGGEGDDVLYPMDYSPSSYDGGPGNDELSYSSQGFTGSTGEIHALGGGAATIVRAYNVSDSAQGFETFEGFDGPTKFYGSADVDHFIGTKNNDWFLPLGGNDIIDGGESINPFGNDADVLSMGASTAPITFDLTDATVTGEGTDTYTDVELLQGSPQNDRFEGDPHVDGIIQIDGYGGHDVLDLSTANWPQSVYLGPDTPPNWLWAMGIAVVIGSDENDRLVFASGDVRAHFRGGRGDDTLIGGPLDDVLTGGPGNDTLRGKGGVDTCSGGPGSDTVLSCEA